MQKTKFFLIIAVAVAIVCSAYLISIGIRHFQGGDPIVRVTGLSERQITSDLIILPIRVTASATGREQAYQELQVAKSKALTFLKSQGLDDTEVSFGSVSVLKDEECVYDRSTYDYKGTRLKGYVLSVDLTIRSSKVDKVEKISSTISELIASGVNLDVQKPRYYYTKLNELKTEMIKEAADDAYMRASLIAEGGKKSLGGLKGTSLGVFQVVGLYQDEEFRWGGSLNTESKEKMVSITVKSSYIID